MTITNANYDIDIIEKSGLFDKSWYLSEYSDVASLGLHPVEHYLRLGARLLRNPSQKFDTRFYLESNPDVAATGINPLMHYVMRGAKEGRAPLPLSPSAKPHVLTPDPLQPVPEHVVNQPVQRDKSSFRGFFDRLDNTTISGWAVDRSKPGKPVSLTVYLDGIPLLDMKTSQSRPDVSRVGVNGDLAGFSLTFPAGLFPAGSTIDIRFSETGESLSKSPRQVENGPGLKITRHSTYIDAYRSGIAPPTAIVVPIFNAFEAVSECLNALAKHVSEQTAVLLLDDCSTDPRIPALLQSFAKRPGWKMCRNEQNLGYTCSINKGIAMFPGSDIVLLNSDTMVTERWLENMRYCAYARSNVATVTALSNNAGAFSAPEIGVHNPVPSHLTQDQFAREIVHAGEGHLLEIPTGNGFCMYIRRAALTTFGNFDEKKFPRGYGEENDFCMRAVRSGWVNLLCDKAYVFHKRSQSFQGEKSALMEAGSLQVNSDYPEYRFLTRCFRNVEFSYMRYRARKASIQATAHQSLQRILYVISTQTGGTPQTNLDLMMAMKGRYHCYLLRCDASTLTLSQLVDGELQPIETHKLLRTIDPISHRSDEYDRVVLDILYRYSISLLHIRHVAWHSLGLAQAARSISIPVIYSVHDFYTVCPSVNLVDGNNQYCAGRCTEGKGECRSDLWARDSLPPLRNSFIHRWRGMFNEFMQSCDRFVTTTAAAADIFCETYPEARPHMKVIPHGRDFATCLKNDRKYTPGTRIRVLVPGNISITKGALLIKQMAELDKEARFEFHILGKAAPMIRNIGVHHGEYARSTFSEKVSSIAPHIGIVLSIWPETYCHTLTEMWSCGVPVFGIDLGAVGERIRASGAGWLISPNESASEILKKMEQAVANEDEFKKKILATKKWQSTEGIWNNTTTMAVEYRMLYQELLRGGKAGKQKRIGLVIRGETVHPATTHIRVLSPFKLAPVAELFDARPVTVPWLLANGMDRLDGLLVQRDAVPPEHTDALIDSAKAHGLPIVYEIDDLLWNLPQDHTDHGITEAHKGSMLKIASCATTVTTSTHKLAEELSSIARHVEVIPNALDEALWLKPLAPEFIKEVGQKLGLTPGKKRILYMGTKSHAADLSMISSAIKTVTERMPELQIMQIGGGHLLPQASEIKVPNEFKEYPAFVMWFRAVSTYATIAIAPLRDHPFNMAKSDIKTLDYALARIPAVYSDVGPYAEAIIHEQTGMLCQNNASTWSKAVIALLQNEGLQEKIREEAFERARNRGLNTIANKWREVLEQTFHRAP